MIRKIKEDVKMIRLGANTALTTSQISKAVQDAFGSRGSAKFCTDKLWIQVSFLRDGTPVVSSNIRSQRFLRDYHEKSKRWTIQSIKSFVYQWMQLSRRTLY